ADWARFALQAAGKEMSSTMAIVRMLTALLKDPQLGPRIVPIVADEARTFGMANLFRQVGIYSAQGQLYEPEDIGSVLAYREARDGQILEEGITEAGAISSWTAAGTSYSVNGLPMLPFYIYYSMFGFQRIGDLIWAAADQRTRGFLIGATSGRTTLGGEGLQHQDGYSHLAAAAVPNCRAYDPAYAYEVAVLVEHGMQRMLDEQCDEFYYLTVTNENLAQPDMPEGEETRTGILRGMHRVRAADATPQVRLLGAGPMLDEAMRAAQLLRDEHGLDAEVWSVTSFSELARGGRGAERAQALQQWQAAAMTSVDAAFSDLAGALRNAAPRRMEAAIVRLTRQLQPLVYSMMTLLVLLTGYALLARRDRPFEWHIRHALLVAVVTSLALSPDRYLSTVVAGVQDVAGWLSGPWTAPD
ncbi:type IV secretion system protein, partial [Bordetella pertussis]